MPSRWAEQRPFWRNTAVDTAAAVIPPAIAAVASAADIRLEALLGILEESDRAAARIADQVGTAEDPWDTAVAEPATGDAALRCEAVATPRPGEVDTSAPPGGVAALPHAVDMSDRREEDMAGPAVVLRTPHAGLHTEQPGEPSVGHTASGR